MVNIIFFFHFLKIDTDANSSKTKVNDQSSCVVSVQFFKYNIN